MMWLSEAARALGAEYAGADVEFTSVGTDTRALAAGALFVALKGERFDGGDFVEQAFSQGAAAAMVRDPGTAPAGRSLLVVADTRLALGALAAYWRTKFSIPLVALTGSNGKTTVKEMLAAILRAAAGGTGAAGEASRVLATTGNLNNDIGMPLTLLGLRPAHRYAVIEMGMNHGGEIRYLTHLARPDVALVNNAQRAHLGEVGSIDAVARAKGEIFEGLPADGTGVVNADDPFAPLWRAQLAGHKVVEFGLDRPTQVSGRYRLAGLHSEIEIDTPLGQAAATLRAPGVHNVRNALAAAAAGVALAVPLAAIAAGLTGFSGVKGRLQIKPGLHGATVIDDSYNANPDSVDAALAVLGRAGGKRLFVLGDMGELGEDGPGLHAEVGARARAAGIDSLYALGELSAHAVRAFGPGARHFSRIEDLLAATEAALAADVTVLVKGSRFMRMERVVKRVER